MAHVIIIYGSTGGNTEMVCQKIAEILKKKNHKTTLQRAEWSKPEDLTKGDLCILGSPTYEHGVIQHHMGAFLKQCKIITRDHRFAVVGLGDPKYDEHYNIESANILEAFVKEHGGEEVIHPLRINKTPIPHLENEITEWALHLSKLL
ncbi:MAG: flavodoxin family protein [bacterium]|nr:flavodoxin family protein [bacterium]